MSSLPVGLAFSLMSVVITWNALNSSTTQEKLPPKRRQSNSVVIEVCQSTHPYTTELELEGKRMCAWTQRQPHRSFDECPEYRFFLGYAQDYTRTCEILSDVVACICETTSECFSDIWSHNQSDSNYSEQITSAELHCIREQWKHVRTKRGEGMEGNFSEAANETTSTTGSTASTTTSLDTTTVETTVARTSIAATTQTTTITASTTFAEDSTISSDVSQKRRNVTVAQTSAEASTTASFEEDESSSTITTTDEGLEYDEDYDRRTILVYKNDTAYMLTALGGVATTLLSLVVLILKMWFKLERRQQIREIREQVKRLSRRNRRRRRS